VVGGQAVLQVGPRGDVAAKRVREMAVAQAVRLPPHDHRRQDVFQVVLEEV